jgi:nicotinate-nucleotide pyrophosphorylase (carboxylating)
VTELDLVQLEDITRVVQRALAEDLGSGDVTAALVPEGTIAQAHVFVREAAILCGSAWVETVFEQLDPNISVTWLASDADSLASGTTVCEIAGCARSILSGERTALNFLQLLSGTATRTADYVKAVAGTSARILDTRKTIPGLRLAQKYAVRCGGGSNHRIGLYDAVLIKENHIAASGSLSAAVDSAKAHAGALLVEAEVEDLIQLAEALTTQVDRLLLDNFQVADLYEAVRMRAAAGKAKIELEASGGITLANVSTIAATGVDFISIGSITKDVTAVDYSLRFV